jgi:hypothetical protein
MKAKPIIFSGPMVRALMRTENPKTMTRRIAGVGDDEDVHTGDNGTYIHAVRSERGRATERIIKPRYGVGDILYVRERHRIMIPDLDSDKWIFFYDADGEYKEITMPDGFNPMLYKPDRLRPSIHMPRIAARIFLRVTDVRAERLQEITAQDCIAEGMDCDNEINNPDPSTHPGILNWNHSYAQYLFRQLWDSLNAKRGHGWAKNDWVWAYTFERASRPADWEANQ